MKSLGGTDLGHTFQIETRELVLQVVNCCEKDFHVQNELFRHPDRFKILSIANLP